MADEKRLVVVVGATGFQGRGVVSALLGPEVTDKFPTYEYQVKALTRDINSTAALNLKADFPSIDLAPWDPSDAESLYDAFDSAYAVFSMTSTFMLPLEVDDVEFDLGRRIADAARAAGVFHFVWSSLPSIANASHGKFVHANHFEDKFRVAKYLEALPSMAVTVLIPGFFYTNFRRKVYAQRTSDGLKLILTGAPAAKMGFVDPIHDVGIFTRAVLDKGPSHSGYEEFVVQGANTSYASVGKALAKVSGEKVVTEQISVQEFERLVGAEFGIESDHIAVVDMTDMGAWFAIAPNERTAYGTMEPDEVGKAERTLGVKASSMEEFLRRHGPLGM